MIHLTQNQQDVLVILTCAVLATVIVLVIDQTIKFVHRRIAR